MEIRVDIGGLEITDLGYAGNISHADAQADGRLIAQPANQRHVHSLGLICTVLLS